MELDGILKAWTKKVLMSKAMIKAMTKASVYSRTVLFFLACLMDVVFAMGLSPVENGRGQVFILDNPH